MAIPMERQPQPLVLIMLQLNALNVSDSEEASSFESDSDVVHLQCEKEKMSPIRCLGQTVNALMKVKRFN